MDSERIFRIEFHGLALILFAIYGYWLVGGDVSFLGSDSSKIWVQSIVAIISSSLLGFILSTVERRIVFHFNSRRFDSPAIEEHKHDYLTSLANFYKKNSKIENEILALNNPDKILVKRDYNRLYILHQTVLRENIDKELLSFCERRWNMVYTHLNLIVAVLLGIIIGSFTGICSMESINEYCISVFKLLSLIPIGCYVWTGVYSICQNRTEARDIELNWIINFQHQLQGKNKKHD